MPTSAERRRSVILERLEREQAVEVADLSGEFGVSQVSVRRDLDVLERQGLLRRVHGGAVGLLDASLAQPPYAARARLRIKEKERIGRACAAMIRAGDHVILDSGSTALQVARSIPPDLLNSGNLTVITASLPIVQTLGRHKAVDVIVLGGIYVGEHEVMVGPHAIETLRMLHANKFFLGTDGLTFSHGATTANVLEAELNRAMAQASSQVIVASDSSKIGVIGLSTILPFSHIDMLVTDSAAPVDFVTALRDAGVEVVLV